MPSSLPIPQVAVVQSDLGIVHDEADFLCTSTRRCEATRPLERFLVSRDLEDHEAAQHRFLLRELTQHRGAVRIDDGRLLSQQTTSGDPHVRRLGLTKHPMCSLADTFEIVSEKVHRSVIERDQISRHSRTLLPLHLSGGTAAPTLYGAKSLRFPARNLPRSRSGTIKPQKPRRPSGALEFGDHAIAGLDQLVGLDPEDVVQHSHWAPDLGARQ